MRPTGRTAATDRGGQQFAFGCVRGRGRPRRRCSMPEIGRAIAEKAGLRWGSDCDSTGSISRGGSTVTAVGLRVMINSLESCDPRWYACAEQAGGSEPDRCPYEQPP